MASIYGLRARRVTVEWPPRAAVRRWYCVKGADGHAVGAMVPHVTVDGSSRLPLFAISFLSHASCGLHPA